jgi:hypothetical protein
VLAAQFGSCPPHRNTMKKIPFQIWLMSKSGAPASVSPHFPPFFLFFLPTCAVFWCKGAVKVYVSVPQGLVGDNVHQLIETSLMLT